MMSLFFFFMMMSLCAGAYDLLANWLREGVSSDASED